MGKNPTSPSSLLWTTISPTFFSHFLIRKLRVCVFQLSFLFPSHIWEHIYEVSTKDKFQRPPNNPLMNLKVSMQHQEVLGNRKHPNTSTLMQILELHKEHKLSLWTVLYPYQQQCGPLRHCQIYWSAPSAHLHCYIKIYVSIFIVIHMTIMKKRQ